jgi:hypothetical protein
MLFTFDADSNPVNVSSRTDSKLNRMPSAISTRAQVNAYINFRPMRNARAVRRLLCAKTYKRMLTPERVAGRQRESLDVEFLTKRQTHDADS